MPKSTCGAILLALVAAHATAAPTSALRIVAISEQPPPGSGVSADVFARFDFAPAINNQGQVAFFAAPADLDSQPFAGNTSVWLASAGDVKLVAAKGNQVAAAGSGTTFDEFFDLNLNDAGDVAFRSRLAGAFVDQTNNQSLWVTTGGLHALAARLGSQAPGAEKGTLFTDFVSPPALNDAGELAFYARTRVGGPLTPLSSGLWRGAAGDVVLLAAAGQHAPGAAQDVVFQEQSFETPFGDRPILNGGGQSALLAFVAGGSVTDANNAGVWTADAAGLLAPLARNGAAAPGYDAANFLSFTSLPVINDAGAVAFLAFLTTAESDGSGGGAPAFTNLGLWSTRTGTLAEVLRIGDVAPGASAGAVFADFDSPVVNSSGRIALGAVVDGESVGPLDESGIWSDGLRAIGQFAPVARGGDQAPGAEPGVVFATFLAPAINAAGQTAFAAVLSGPDVSDAAGNALGIWAQDRGGELRLVARTGQSLEVAPGDVRTIAYVDMANDTGGEDGRLRGFNDLGQLAFRVRFSDGASAIVVSSVAAVPEPASAALLAPLCCLGVFRAIRRAAPRCSPLESITRGPDADAHLCNP